MTEGNGDVRELPKGWCWVCLQEISQSITDGDHQPPPKSEQGIPFIVISNIRNHKIDFSVTKFVSNTYYEKIQESRKPRKGDILYTVTGSFGIPCLIDFEEKFCFQRHIGLIRLKEEVSRKYVFYLLRSPVIYQQAQKVATGTAQKTVSLSVLRNFEIPLPPFFEQNRIVEKIEELFSDVDQGVASLKTAQKQLKVYRQAVLKWAFEGKLTEAWRAQHSSTLKTGEALLAEIKTERENLYQQQLAEWETAVKEWEAIGKAGKKPAKPSKPKDLLFLTDREIIDIPSLPDSWKWIQLGEVMDDIEAGKSFRCEERPPRDSEIGVAKVSAVTWGEYNELESKTCLEQNKAEEKFLIQPGDFLFSRANTIELVGACVIAQRVSLNVMLSDKTLRFKFSTKVSQKFILYFLKSRYGRNEIERLATGNQESMRNIGQERILRMRTPFPCPAEQEQVVQEVESRLSICDQLEATIIENLQKAEALRQSILKQAFEGKLVPQDPNDEPAEKLLERIWAERQASGNTDKKSKPSHQQLTLQEL